jgi:hypothetical protein
MLQQSRRDLMRAPSPHIRLSRADAAIVKGMLDRGDRQSDIASYFGVNGGRIAEISTGDKFASVDVAPANTLPPPGPYVYGDLRGLVIAKLDAIAAHLDQSDVAAAKKALTDVRRRI